MRTYILQVVYPHNTCTLVHINTDKYLKLFSFSSLNNTIIKCDKCRCVEQRIDTNNLLHRLTSLRKCSYRATDLTEVTSLTRQVSNCQENYVHHDKIKVR